MKEVLAEDSSKELAELVLPCLHKAFGIRLIAVMVGENDLMDLNKWVRDPSRIPLSYRKPVEDMYKITDLLLERENLTSVIAWFTGMNPWLDYESPIMEIAQRPDEVFHAAKAFSETGE